MIGRIVLAGGSGYLGRAAEVDGAAAVVHLAGERVDCRPTRRSVDELIRSRVEPVRAMGAALARCVEPPGAWVQLSTMAIYGDAGETVLDERVPPSGIGPRQMVTVALTWETAVRQASDGVPRRGCCAPAWRSGATATPRPRGCGSSPSWAWPGRWREAGGGCRGRRSTTSFASSYGPSTTTGCAACTSPRHRRRSATPR